jgi:hypothetical protein
MNKSNPRLNEVESQTPDKDGLALSFGPVVGVLVPTAGALLDRKMFWASEKAIQSC